MAGGYQSNGLVGVTLDEPQKAVEAVNGAAASLSDVTRVNVTVGQFDVCPDAGAVAAIDCNQNTICESMEIVSITVQ